MKNKILLVFFVLNGLTACSTPYRDDYTNHINQLYDHGIQYQHVNINLKNNNTLDLRGEYFKNDSLTSTPHMSYSGSGGMIGVMAQMATHAALVNAERENKLSEAQQKANKKIAPVLNIAQSISLNDVFEEDTWQSTLGKIKNQSVMVKPIFFCSDDMTKFHLKAVAWIEDKNDSDEHVYRNLFTVHHEPLDTSQKQRLLDGDVEYLTEILSQLLSTSLHIIREDVKGHYVLDRSKQKNFVYNRKLFRGQVVEKYEEYDVIKDIRSWLVAYPNIAHKLQ